MTIKSTAKKLTSNQMAAIFELWNNEYPRQLSYGERAGMEGYLEGLLNQRHYFAMGDNDTILGWAFVFDRDNERWFAIIVDSLRQGQGIGTRILNELKDDEISLSGWVTDHSNYLLRSGVPYISPLEFYIRNGFTIKRETRLEIEVLSAVKIQWQVSTPVVGPK